MQSVYGSPCDGLVGYLNNLKHKKLHEMREIQSAMLKFNTDPQKYVKVLT